MSEPVITEKERGSASSDASATPAEPEKKKREYKDFGHDEEKATRKSFAYPLRKPPSLLCTLR